MHHLPLVRDGRLRKRWRYVCAWSPAMTVCASRVQVGPLHQEFWAVWDGEHLHERTRLRRGRVLLPDGALHVFDGSALVDLRLARGESVSVVTPVGRASTWTRKEAVAVTGEVVLDGRAHVFDGHGLVDDSAGHHPRRTHWWWSCGGGTLEDGRSVTWNAVHGINDRPGRSESTVWLDGAPGVLGQVVFAADLSAMTFEDGSGLVFSEQAVRVHEQDAGLLSTSYRQPFGTFAGTLPGGLRLREGHGVMEEHRALW